MTGSDRGVADSQPVLVDSHVHFHECFVRDCFLDAAHENFLRAARTLDLRKRPLGFLLLTEIDDHTFFRALRQGTGTTSRSPWRFVPTSEAESLIGYRDGEPSLIIVSGSQVTTREGLEVLALCCSTALGDGFEILEAVETVRAAEGLPTIPWGFGKWSMGRGRILADLLNREEPSEIYLGDTSVRWRHAGRPRAFRSALGRGIRILPGSDPLPFPNDADKAGSYGFLLNLPLDLAKPAQSLKRALQKPDTVPEPYGNGERLLGFIRKQIGMQIRKRLKRRPN